MVCPQRAYLGCIAEGFTVLRSPSLFALSKLDWDTMEFLVDAMVENSPSTANAHYREHCLPEGKLDMFLKMRSWHWVWRMTTIMPAYFTRDLPEGGSRV